MTSDGCWFWLWPSLVLLFWSTKTNSENVLSELLKIASMFCSSWDIISFSGKDVYCVSNMISLLLFSESLRLSRRPAMAQSVKCGLLRRINLRWCAGCSEPSLSTWCSCGFHALYTDDCKGFHQTANRHMLIRIIRTWQTVHVPITRPILPISFPILRQEKPKSTPIGLIWWNY